MSPTALAASLFFVLLSLALLLPACTNVWWMMHAWRSPAVHAAISGARGGRHARVSFSAIVPFRHEADVVVRGTVERLLAQTHDDLEVVLSVGDDDPEAVVIAQRLADEHPDRIRVSVDLSARKNKPRQLNSALRLCSKDYVAVFDAESLTHPELFAHVDALAQRTGAEVLQFGVQLVNHRTTWFSLRNCLEYFFWFRSRLHLHAEHGFIPLGGNTVFVRRELLDSFSGWDEEALAEDCDLGVRLSAHGVRVAVSYDARIVTREETPDSVGSLVRQRSRWNQGFLQVLAKGAWRGLPTRRQRMLARYTLVQPFLQALTLVAMPLGAGAALFGAVPLPVALLTFAPLAPMVMSLLFESVALSEFCRSLDLPLGAGDRVRLVVTALPYQVVMGWAALRAVVRESRGRQDWEKTPHTGHHLVKAGNAVGATS